MYRISGSGFGVDQTTLEFLKGAYNKAAIISEGTLWGATLVLARARL